MAMHVRVVKTARCSPTAYPLTARYAAWNGYVTDGAVFGLARYDLRYCRYRYRRDGGGNHQCCA